MAARVELLGSPRVVLDTGDAVALRPTTRDRALAYLAHHGTVVTRDRLGYLFWPDEPDATARHNVRQLLKRMRRLPWLGSIGALEVSGDAIRWPVLTDVAALRVAAAEDRWEPASEPFSFLAGFERNATLAFETWLLDERKRIDDELRSLALDAAGSAEREGYATRAAQILGPLLDGDSADELLTRYMDLAVRGGRRDAALSAFERVSARLRDELGIEPPQAAAQLAARLRVRGEPPHPAGGHRTVGRAREREEILGLLAQPACRLLTLLGPGGIGKSTLAAMVVEAAGLRYADGATLVSLEAVTDPEETAHEIATALDLTLDARLDPAGQLMAALRERHLLLSLDNVEHLPASWPAFSRLLRACPGVDVLVTSRERLRLAEEWTYEVTGLTDMDAIALVQGLAGRVAPGVAVSPGDARAISQALGSSPLGIGLAVPWLRLLTAAEVVAEVGRDLGMLSGGEVDAQPRHQSIEAAMAHSWVLASLADREAVEALSVFVAPYSWKMASAVAGMDRLTLRSLIDQSLVQRRPDGRFASHPLVRQYAGAYLAADDTRRRSVRDRHAAAVLGALDPPPPEPNRETMLLLDDAVAAWRHVVETGDWAAVDRSADGLIALLDAGGRCQLGLQLLTHARTALGVDTKAAAAASCMAALLVGEATLLFRQGRREESAAAAAEAVKTAAAAGDAQRHGLALLILGWARKWLEGDEAQFATALEALPIAESLGDPILVARVRNELGCSAPTFEACRDHLRQALVVLPVDGPSGLRAGILANLGNVLWALGDLRGALECEEQGRRVAEGAQDGSRLADVLADLAFTEADAGNLEVARRHIAQAEELSRGMESVDVRAYVVLVAGEIRLASADLAGARERMAEALRLASGVGNEPFMLRALRLHGQILMEEGRTDEGLAVLAFVLPRASRRGDFASEITNPRVWAARTAGLDQGIVDRATTSAADLSLGQVADAALNPDTRGPI